MRLRYVAVPATVITLGVAAGCYPSGPSVLESSNARVSLQNGGIAGTVTIEVEDANKLPVTGLSVATQSYSGWTQDSLTDSNGRATIRPGENEVTAVRFGEQTVDFDKSNYFLPDCSNGLSIAFQLRRR